MSNLIPSIDRYILRLVIVPMLGVFALAASLLMLDKMLRLFDFVAVEGGPVGVVFKMLGALIPEYASLAIPLGLLLGILLAFLFMVNMLGAIFVLPALAITGRKADVPIATFNGTPFVLDMVREGQVEMDIGESLGWAGYAAIDNIMRMLCGKPEVAKLNVPLLVFDKDNIQTAGVPMAAFQVKDVPWILRMKNRWKISSTTRVLTTSVRDSSRL